MNKKDFWIGIGIGAGVGLAGGFMIGNQVQKRKARKEIRKVRRAAYLKGAEDASAEAERLQKELDELTAAVVWVDPTDSKEDIEKKIQEHYQEEQPEEDKPVNPKESDGKNAAASVVDEKAYPETKLPSDDIFYAVKDDSAPTGYRYPFTVSGNNVIFYGAAGTELRYPRYLVMNKHGELLDEMEIRSNLQSYESDTRKLIVIWNTMGWGVYRPGDYAKPNPVDDNFDNEELFYGDEPEIKTEERERYLDEVERYVSHPEEAPRLISREDFNDECYLDKVYIDYFDVDNQFIENSDTGEPVDAVTLFGTNDGKELFARKVITDDDDDPNIVHVKNFAQNCVMEVTRFHRSYQSVRDGSAYVNGGSN